MTKLYLAVHVRVWAEFSDVCFRFPPLPPTLDLGSHQILHDHFLSHLDLLIKAVQHIRHAGVRMTN